MSRARISTQCRTSDPRGLVRVVDIASLGLLLAAGLISNSLLVIGLLIADATMTFREAWNVSVSRRLSAKGLQDYQYGFGKILQTGNLVVAGTAAVAGFWLGGGAFSHILTGVGDLLPLALALAATANAFVMVWNGIVIFAHREAVDRFERVLRLARARFVASLIVIQILLTVAVLAKDPELAFWIDSLGAIFVSLLIVIGALKLAWDCIRDLIDHPLDKDQEQAILALLFRAGVKSEELVDLRTRQCAERIFAELTLCLGDTVPVEEVGWRLAGLLQVLQTEIQDLDLVIKLQGSEPQRTRAPR